MSEENELPEGWVSTKLVDICTIIMGQSPPSSEYNESGQGLPFFQGKAEFTDLYPEVRKWCTAPTKIAEANDILLSIRAPVGPTNLAPSLCCIGRGLAAIRPVGEIQVRYILYSIRTFNSKLTQLGTGSTFEAIAGDVVRAFEIPLAPLSEQQRIVSAIEQQFTRLDAGIAALRRAQAKLKRYRAAVLKAAVEGKLTEAWRAEHPTTEPASMLLERILKERRARWEADLMAKGKDPAKVKYIEPAKPDMEGLPGVPEGWCWATMEQLTSAVRTICYGILMPKDNVADGVPYVRVKDIKGDRINVEALHKTTPEIAAAYTRASLKNGDLLLAIRGTYGRVAEVPNELSGANITQDTARLDISENVNRNYIAVHLRSPISQKYFQKVSRGVAVKGVNIADVKCTPIMLPPYSEQEEIVAEVEQRLSIVGQLEAIIEAELKRAERLRQSILKEAFAGRLVPQDPNDEPASVLLERIRKEREGQKKGANGNGRFVRVSDEPVQIDVEGTRQVELWEVLGEASN